MGRQPAGAISTEALYLTADIFEESFPKAATMLRSSTYVDDIVDSTTDKSAAISRVEEVESLLEKGGFKVKD